MVSYLAVVCVQPAGERDDGIVLLCDWVDPTETKGLNVNANPFRGWFMTAQAKLGRRMLGGDSIPFSDHLSLHWIGQHWIGHRPAIVRFAALLQTTNSRAAEPLLKELSESIYSRFSNDQLFGQDRIQADAQPILSAIAARHGGGSSVRDVQAVLEASEKFESKYDTPVDISVATNVATDVATNVATDVATNVAIDVATDIVGPRVVNPASRYQHGLAIALVCLLIVLLIIVIPFAII
jgi:hypothetical protein